MLYAAADDALAARDEQCRGREERGGEREEEKIAHAPCRSARHVLRGGP